MSNDAIKEIMNFRVTAKSNGALKENLIEIFKPLTLLNPEKIQIFVHGSWADDTRTAFSDLDDFIIIDDDYYTVAETALNEVERTMQEIDPLQHHGHWLIKKSELNNYNNAYIPLFILEDSIQIFGNDQIEASINYEKSLYSVIENAKATLRSIEHHFILLFKNAITVYELKALISSISLFPCLLYQSMKVEIVKKDAINEIEKLLSYKAASLVHWSTKVRESWSIILKKALLNEFVEMNRNKMSDPALFRYFMQVNSPKISFDETVLSGVSVETVNSFLFDSIKILDNASFQYLEPKDYEIAYQKVEQAAINLKATYIGQFGSVSSPGISDMDIIMMFEDQDFDLAVRSISELIENDRTLRYLFCHPPLFICKSNIEFVTALHTMHNLRHTWNPYGWKFCNLRDKKYEELLGLIWSYYVFRQTRDYFKRKDTISSRDLLLQIKMIHKSSDFLNRLFEFEDENHLERSVLLRNKLLTNGLDRQKVLSEFAETTMRFFEIIEKAGEKEKPSKKRIYVGESQVLSPLQKIDDWVKEYKMYGVSYENIPFVFYNLLYRLLTGMGKEEIAFMDQLKNFINNHQHFELPVEEVVLMPFERKVCINTGRENIINHRKKAIRNFIKSIADACNIQYKRVSNSRIK